MNSFMEELERSRGEEGGRRQCQGGDAERRGRYEAALRAAVKARKWKEVKQMRLRAAAE